MNPLRRFRRRWRADGGYREFLGIALPLILTTASLGIQHFVDVVFLTWYSTESLAASVPAGITHFVYLSFFMGTARYVNTFVAQYTGARRPHRVGPALWQGVYLAGLCGLLSLIPAALSAQIFDLIGHESAVRRAEAIYFRVLCYGSGFHVLQIALSCFYTGRGQTWAIFVVGIVATLSNIAMNYALIFGAWGFPEWGIRGAAWATNLAGLLSALLFFLLIMQRQYRDQFATLKGWRPDPALLVRLIRYGGPNGLAFMLNGLAFTMFILIAGRLGTIELAATNLTLHINGLAFMPLIGCTIAVTTMVGQRLGRDQTAEAEYCTWTGLHLALAYTLVIAAAFVLAPDWFLKPFSFRSQDEDFAAAYALAIPLLRISAVYCVLDSLYMTFTAALEGAGDTRFILCVSVVLSWAVMVGPAFIGHAYFGAGLFLIWGFFCLYACAAGILFYLRFRQGKWKQIRVIEASDIGDEDGATGSQ